MCSANFSKRKMIVNAHTENGVAMKWICVTNQLQDQSVAQVSNLLSLAHTSSGVRVGMLQ